MPPASRLNSQRYQLAELERLESHPDVLFVANRLDAEPKAVAERAVKAKEIMESKNVEIRFYGKVVDQDDRPLAGVRVRAGVREWKVKNLFEPIGVSHYQTKITGLDGLFAFDSLRGDALDIEQIQKEGYILSRHAKKGFIYGPLRHHFVPNPLEPVIYRMWRTNGAVPLYRIDISGSMPRDGTPVPLDLVRNRRATQPGLDTDVRLTLQHDAPPGQRGFTPHYPWRCAIEVPDGGVLETQDEFLYLAPVAGFQPKWVTEFSKGDPDWKAQKEVEFYLQNRGGQQHGSLKVTFKLGLDGTGYFSISGWLNPTGRVLELDSTALPLARPPVPVAGTVAQPTQRGPIFPPGIVAPDKQRLPLIPSPPPGFQALTNRTKGFAPPVPPRPQ